MYYYTFATTMQCTTVARHICAINGIVYTLAHCVMDNYRMNLSGLEQNIMFDEDENLTLKSLYVSTVP